MFMIFKDGEHLIVLGLTLVDGLVFNLYIFYVVECLYGIKFSSYRLCSKSFLVPLSEFLLRRFL